MAIRARDVDPATWAKLLAAAEPPPAVPERFESEKEFQAAVQDLAKRLGWKRRSGSTTRGIPGSPPPNPTADQLNWIDDLRAAGQEVHLWHPSDWPALPSTARHRGHGIEGVRKRFRQIYRKRTKATPATRSANSWASAARASTTRPASSPIGGDPLSWAILVITFAVLFPLVLWRMRKRDGG